MDTAEILSIARRFETLERLLRDTLKNLEELEERVSLLALDLKGHRSHGQE